MNKRQTKLFLSSLVFSICLIKAETERPAVITVQSGKDLPTPFKKEPATFKKTPTALTPKKTSDKKIWFKFKDVSIIEVIEYVANALPVNVVLPQGQDALNVKVTFEYPEKVTPTEAYDKVLAMLKTIGYSVVPQNDFYYIIKNDATLAKQPFPLYINTAPADLPDTDQIIRYMYYFANIQVPQGGGGGSFGGGGGNALQTFLQDVLPKTAVMMFDNSINGMIITDYARNIRSIMEVVVELDSHGFTDAIEIIPLKYTNAGTIAGLFKTLISQTDSSQGNNQMNFGGTPPQAPTSSSHYFAQTTRIVAEGRTNSLIVMGKKEALDRVREFLKKYIDIPLDEGESVLHIYPLQYLNAQAFAPILQQIVNSQSGSSSVGGGMFGGSTGQSSGTTGSSTGKQYFKGVIIAPEMPSGQSNTTPNSFTGASTGATTATPPAPAQQTGNRLVVAAVREDWKRLKKLIADLDRPQPQVAIEVLIVDLTLTGAKVLGSQVRNKEGMFPTGVNAQNSTLGPIQLGGPTISTTAFDALMANLLQLDSTGQNNIASNMTQGSFVLSVQDNAATGIAWVLQALNSYTNAKILSHPFCVTLNNQSTLFQDTATRLLPGAATVKKGATFAPITPVATSLSVAITPMINGESFVNLGINISISEFANGSSNAQINRSIQTNANVKNGQVLVLGGLTKTVTNNTDLGTPGFDQIPLVGWLFKKKTKGVIKSNLAVFICPCILESTNGYSDPFTAQKFLVANQSVNPDENFGGLKDPITRWFFGKTNEESQEKIQDFINSKPFMNKKDYENLQMTQRNRPRSQKNKISFPPVPEKNPIIVKASEKETVVTEPTTQLAQSTPQEKSLVKEKSAPAIHVAHTAQAHQTPKPTIILSQAATEKTEQEELKSLFAQLEHPEAKRDLTTQMPTNLL